MGTPVTVDDDDLECLLLASAAAQMIEMQITSFKQDPAFRRQAQKIESAFTRINRARGDAIRVEEPFDYKNLTDSDKETLTFLYGVKFAHPSDDKLTFEFLRRHGLIMAGQVNQVVTWGDKTQEEYNPPSQLVKITEKGRNLINEIDSAKRLTETKTPPE